MGKREILEKRRNKMSLINREQTIGKMTGVSNNRGQNIEKYMPRKCSATSRILGPDDRSSVQITIPSVNPQGQVVAGSNETIVAISGYIRTKGRSDWEIEKIL